VGGLLMERLGSLPKEGQCVAFDGFDVTVERMQGNRILTLRVAQRFDDEIEEH
jgi:CBS domain containing-hemolysin-like protein